MRVWATAEKAHSIFRASFRGAWLLFLVLQPALFSQTLRLSEASAAPGGHAMVEISFHKQTGKEPSILQWEVTIPSAKLSFPDESAVAGPAARTAGKSVTCAVRPSKNEATRTLGCILYGGLGPIPDGVVTELKLQVLPEAHPGKARVRVDHGLAVTRELAKVPMEPVETSVRIRPK